MKKTIIRIICLLLALLMLCGCRANKDFATGTSTKLSSDFSDKFSRISRLDGKTLIDVPNFNDIEYNRPELDGLKALISELELSLSEGKEFRDITALLDKCYVEYHNYETMYSLADIRSCLDMSDEFYARELSWCESHYDELMDLFEDIYYICGSSDMAKKLERRYFWDGFAAHYAPENDNCQPESSPADELILKEYELLAEYRALIANPVIEMKGKEVYLNDFLLSADDEEYWQALDEYYIKYNPLLAEIYIEMVKLRQALAQELGYESYEQMQYIYGFERDYRAEQAAKYLADIKQHIVPLYRQVMASSPYDSIDFSYLSHTESFDAVSAAAEKIGGSVAEAFDFMQTYSFFDNSISPRKANLSFQTYLMSYEAPYLFVDSLGDVEDILSFSHEFGHYVDSYVNYDSLYTIDISECFSQAMEYLMLGYYDSALSAEQIDNLYRLKMLDTLDLYVQQASLVEFEHILYSTEPDKLSAEYINELYRQLVTDYAYGSDEPTYALGWIDIPHLFESPFYVISYPVSNDIAMQIYELEQQAVGAGIVKYEELLHRETTSLIEMAESAGLKSPFSEGRIEQVAKDLAAIFDK